MQNQVTPLTSCTCSCGLHAALCRPDLRPRRVVDECEVRENFYVENDEWQDDEQEVDAHCYEDNSYVELDDEETTSEREEAEAAMASLQLEVRALKKYKTNYELLCGQLGELNAQIGLQLQRHEADVASFQATIADLQTEKLALEARGEEAQQALTAQRDAARQDQEYSEHVHRQLSTAAELLKTTEKRLEEQGTHFNTEIDRLKAQLAVTNEERAGYLTSVKELEKELEALRSRETSEKEQEALRRRREKSKHKKELMVRAAKLRTASDEMETQRSVLRATKKQLAQVQAENDALRKQVANVKRDGAHLSDIIDSQRNEHDIHAEQLLRVKKTKKQLANRVTLLTQDVEQLENELSNAKEELVDKNTELEVCRTELKGIRGEVRQSNQELSDARSATEKLVKHVDVLQKAEKDQCSKVKAEEQGQHASRERRYRNELIRMRELLSDNQQRASESSRDVQKLRRELLGVQKMLHGCMEDRKTAQEPIDQWAEVMRNSIKAEDSVLFKNAIMEQVRAFGT